MVHWAPGPRLAFLEWSHSHLTVDWLPARARRRLDHISLTMPQCSQGLLIWALQGSKKGPGSEVVHFPLHDILPKQITGLTQIEGVVKQAPPLSGRSCRVACKRSRYREEWRIATIYAIHLLHHCRLYPLRWLSKDSIRVCHSGEEGCHTIQLVF